MTAYLVKLFSIPCNPGYTHTHTHIHTTHMYRYKLIFPQMSVACLWSQMCLRWQGKQEVCDSVILLLTKQGGERVKVKGDWRDNNSHNRSVWSLQPV